MAAPKPITNIGGDSQTAARVAYGAPGIPADPEALWAAILQLQNTVNALIKHFNAHQHSALNAAPATDLHTATAQTAQNLFTAS